MNTFVRFGGYAVRREFRLGLMFHGSVPPKDAPARRHRISLKDGRPIPHTGENVPPSRRYKRYILLYRTVEPSYQGYSSVSAWRRYYYDDSDTAVFMSRRAKCKGDKQRINRVYRHAFKQQLARGLEAPAEFHVPGTIHYWNITW
jgi:hypothetical protein